jgi:tellurite resistance protein TehA-like permease
LEWVRADSDWLRPTGTTILPGVRIAPNWFTAAMGTGIVANAAMLLPLDLPGLHALALAAWVAAVLLLARFAALAVEQSRRDLRDRRALRLAAVPTAALAAPPHRPSRSLAGAPFWGAPPMALMTVAAGTLLVGRDLVGARPALIAAVALWTVGTVGGLVAALAIPRWLLAHPDRRLDQVFATWLLPVVPPIVSATSGAALIAHAPAGALRTALLLACWALLGFGVAAVAATTLLLRRRLLAHGTGPAHMVPTLFIALGPLGQSVTAACLLAALAPEVVGGPLARVMALVALAWGIPVFLLALAWLTVATAVTIRTAIGPGLPFAASWWSFIFPLGTCVTGGSALSLQLGAPPLAWVAGLLFALLLAAWVTVACATARHAYVRRGATPLPMPA